MVQSAVSAWEKGANEPTLETLKQIAVSTDSSPEWLAFGSSRPQERAEGISIGVIGPPDTALWHGQAKTAASFSVPPHWLRTVTDASAQELALLISNDLCLNEIINSGDLILIDLRVRKIGAPGIYAINHPASAELRVARCQRLLKTGKLLVYADNPHSAIFEDNIEDDDITVVGKAIWVGRHL